MTDIEEIKKKIYQIAAITDRGQRLNKLIAPMYQEKLKEMGNLIDSLESFNTEVSEEKLSGEWELIYSTVELFRSSPFFLAIEKALNDEFKSNLFFKLHQLQVGSFGISTIGRIAQKIDFDKTDTTLACGSEYSGDIYLRISNYNQSDEGYTCSPCFTIFTTFDRPFCKVRCDH